MTNIIDMLLSGNDGRAVSDLSKQFNLPEAQTRSAMEDLIPALTRGMQNNSAQGTGLDELLDALRTGEHAKYMDNPTTLGNSATTNDGNDILGHIFGNKEVSREVANRASKNSGISSAVLKKMLPVLATLAMGALSKGVFGGSNTNNRATNNAQAGGILGTLLDSDRDGSIWDDVLSMAAKSMLR